MSLEKDVQKELRTLSILEISLVKLAYFSFGVIAYKYYQPFALIDWWIYLIFALISSFPIYMHFFSFNGSFIEMTKKYLSSNMISLQLLLFFTMFYISFVIQHFIPMLTNISWIVYAIIILITAIVGFRKIGKDVFFL